MREKPKDHGRLLHIAEAIDNIYTFLNGKTVTDFHNDKLLYFGVVKNLEIIGEASYMLTPEFKELHPLTAWSDLPVLKAQISAYLSE